MNILDIAIAKKLAGGGGGSGTDNYNDLSNLPKINDTTLSGNKSSSALGLQSEINSDSKLASDLVDDTNQDNKFVTSTEKQTWNNKQNAIDSDHKLSSSLVSFTTAEAAALASGIDSSKVGQISTNQTNILYVLGKTGKNLLSKSTLAISGSTWHDIEPIKAGSYIVTGRLPNTASNYSIDFRDENDNDVGSFAGVGWSTLYNDGMSLTLTGTATKVKIWAAGTSSGDELTTAMVCTPEDWAVGHDYAPYALPNYDLTYLQAQDRAALAEEIDAGAKNKLKNNSYTCTGSPGRYGRDDSLSIPAGDYVLIAKLNQAQNAALTLVWDGNQHDFNASGSFSNTIKTWNVHATNTITSVWVYFNGTNDTWTEVMLCTKAAFGVSSKFVPYRPNYDLVVSNLKKNTIVHSKINSSYNFHGFKITTGNRGTGTAYFMGNGTQVGAGVISFSFSLSSTPILYVDKKMVAPSYVKFYYVGTDTFYIVFYTGAKWDDITILGTFTADEVEEYFSNTEIPSGATQLTETAYPTT